jgi:peptidoglycan-associated lipoprotein
MGLDRVIARSIFFLIFMEDRKAMLRKKLTSLLAMSLLLVGALIARPCGVMAEEADADGQSSPVKVWLGAGALFFEADDPNESGQLYEVRAGYDLDPNWTLEAGIGGSPFMEGNDFNAPDGREATFNGRNSPGENWMLKGNLDVLYHLDGSSDKTWDPYLSLIGGTQWFGKRRQGSNFEPFGGPGVGVSYWFNRNLALRADYNVVVAGYSNSDINHHLLGMVYYNWGAAGSGGESSPADENQEAAPQQELGAKSSGPLKPIYFDFDKSNITSTAQQTLKENAEWMKKNPDQKVSLEGHCDERGTNEYNLALGARRAKSAYEYLRALGIPNQQMSTVSYGEEFPADPGHNEAAWAKNRRVESLIKK